MSAGLVFWEGGRYAGFPGGYRGTNALLPLNDYAPWKKCRQLPLKFSSGGEMRARILPTALRPPLALVVCRAVAQPAKSPQRVGLGCQAASQRSLQDLRWRQRQRCVCVGVRREGLDVPQCRLLPSCKNHHGPLQSVERTQSVPQCAVRCSPLRSSWRWRPAGRAAERQLEAPAAAACAPPRPPLRGCPLALRCHLPE